MKNRGLLATFPFLLVALALFAAGCGGGDDNGGSDTTGDGGSSGDTLKIVSDLPLQGSDRSPDHPDGARDPVRLEAGQQQGRRPQRRLPVLRRLNRRGRQVGRGEVRGERPHLRRPEGRGRHRHVQLRVRRDHHPGPERGADRNGQPGEHRRRPDARRSGHLVRRAGQVLPVRRQELRACRRVRRQPGQDRRPVHEEAGRQEGLHPRRQGALREGRRRRDGGRCQGSGPHGRRSRGLGPGAAELPRPDDQDQGIRCRRHLHRRRVDEQRRPAA